MICDALDCVGPEGPAGQDADPAALSDLEARLSALEVSVGGIVPSVSAFANRRDTVSIPQTSTAIIFGLVQPDEEPGFNGFTSGPISLAKTGTIFAAVSFRMKNLTGNDLDVQCRLFSQRIGDGSVFAMTNYVPRLRIPAGSETTTALLGRISSGSPDSYDVTLRCLAGFGGTSAPPLAEFEEGQLIVWSLADPAAQPE